MVVIDIEQYISAHKQEAQDPDIWQEVISHALQERQSPLGGLRI
jgi:hypothetical protein